LAHLEGLDDVLAELSGLRSCLETPLAEAPWVRFENEILIGSVLGRLQRYGESQSCLEALGPLPKGIPMDLRARALNAQAINLRHLGREAEAYTLFGNLAREVEKTGNHTLLARVLTNQANLLHDSGDLEAAVPLRERALASARKTEDPSFHARLALNLGYELAALEDANGALARFEEADRMLAEVTDPLLRANVQAWRGKILLDLRDPASALPVLLAGAEMLSVDESAASTRARLQLYTASALLALDRPVEALHFAEAADRYFDGKPEDQAFEARLRLALTVLQLGQVARSSALFQNLGVKSASVVEARLRIEFLEARAQWAQVLGNPNLAIESLRSANAERMEADQVKTRRLLGLMRVRVEAETAKVREQEAEARSAELVVLNTELRRKHDELQLLHAEKEQMLTVVAHDLRNQLGAAVNFSEVGLLRQDSPAEELRESLQTVYTVNRSTLELLGHLLSMEQLDHDQAKSFPVVLALGTWLPEVVARVDNLGKVKGMRVVLEGLERVHEVLADETWLRLVVENFLSNGFKYGPPGSEVRLAVHREGNDVCFTVADRGPGISAAEQAQLFSKFHRAGSVPTGSEFSTGLGLYLVKRYAELLEGEVGYRDREGGGAIFYLRLRDCAPRS
jgi:signal transduction histidine kinase